jgi:transcriptional regulator with XRE-family HTH domain
MFGRRRLSGGRKPSAPGAGFTLDLGHGPTTPGPLARCRLGQLRVRAGLSQSDVADLVGVRQPTVSLWENGHSVPTPKAQRRLAELYGVTLSDLGLGEQAGDPGGRMAYAVADSPRFGSMKALRPEEEWARDIISQTLSVPVEQNDDNSQDGMHDLWILHPDRPAAAVEITAAADSESIQLSKLMNTKER